MGKVHPPLQKIAAGAPAEPPLGRPGCGPPDPPGEVGPGVKGGYKDLHSAVQLCNL